MCLYPKLIRNPKYKRNKKNKGNVPEMKDDRVAFVPIGCERCFECRKQKANSWRIRLLEEIRNNPEGYFITFSFNDKSLRRLENMLDKKYVGYELDNALAKKGIKLFRERWRKEFGRSPRYWVVSELGQKNTERIHLHGVIFGSYNKKDITRLWRYGNVWYGDYMNESTINYSIKYFSKQDEKHKYYKPLILCSNGIGKGYIYRHDSKLNKYKKKNTNTAYKMRNGMKLNLPIYYRNKIYSEDEKENLWLELLDKNERYVDGKKIDISKGYDVYDNLVIEARQENERLGFGSPEIDEDRKRYEEDRRLLLSLERWKR